MQKFIILIPFLFFLTGCPAMMWAKVKNENSKPFVVFLSGDYGSAEKIPSRSEKEIVWFRDCIAVVDGGKLFFFDGSNIPTDYIDVHIFSTSVRLTYRNSTLSYVNEAGSEVALPTKSSCNGT